VGLQGSQGVGDVATDADGSFRAEV
jgi:hypothetical protein